MSDKLDTWGKWKREAIRGYDRASSDYLHNKSLFEKYSDELKKAKIMSRLPWYKRWAIKGIAWQNKINRHGMAVLSEMGGSAAQLAPDSWEGVAFDLGTLVVGGVGKLAKLGKLGKLGRLGRPMRPTTFKALQDVHKAAGFPEIASRAAQVQKAQKIIRGVKAVEKTTHVVHAGHMIDISGKTIVNTLTKHINIEGRIPSVGDSGADFGSVRKFGSKLDVPGWVGGASSLGLSSGNKSLLLGDSPLWDVGAKLRLAGIRQDTWHSPWRSPSLGLSLRGSGGGSLSNLWNAGSSFSSGSTLGASLAPTRLNASTSLTSGGSGARSSAGFSPALEGLQDRLSRLNRGLETPVLSGGRSSIAGTLSGVGSYGSGFGAQGFGPNLRLNVPGLGDFGTGPAGVGLARFSSIRVPSMRLRGPTTLALASQGLASPGLAVW